MYCGVDTVRGIHTDDPRDHLILQADVGSDVVDQPLRRNPDRQSQLIIAGQPFRLQVSAWRYG